ncbi:unnamed protein product [Rangifer tarandus platyrhynchus]|uniref:Uncharacterized protein n=2 Tax=Rangifer tarandus platyrhynchus TaxID=3082113 RepID=A0ACB0DWE0_RANTA|nr:unnamed protein product [Rangifer tarandus platyrhynchus]CAI9692503.1 unnamed protein product [Rangifer tarandus platyrhynchus]
MVVRVPPAWSASPRIQTPSELARVSDNRCHSVKKSGKHRCEQGSPCCTPPALLFVSVSSCLPPVVLVTWGEHLHYCRADAARAFREPSFQQNRDMDALVTGARSAGRAGFSLCLLRRRGPQAQRQAQELCPGAYRPWARGVLPDRAGNRVPCIGGQTRNRWAHQASPSVVSLRAACLDPPERRV